MITEDDEFERIEREINMKKLNVKIQWATPDIDKQIMFMARVSNPANQTSDNTRLLYYCMEEGHVSPFDMANVCLEINTTRDIGRQILRHKSFYFQEFSQRYATTDALDPAPYRECRLQDLKNRQNSIENKDPLLKAKWEEVQQIVIDISKYAYDWSIKNNIAKEQARSILPEGLTSSKIYMSGTMRSWIFYLKQRLHVSTQKEHRVIAEEILSVLKTVAPVTIDAFFPIKSIKNE
jgi:thymidylate synthase (FAD)